MQTYLTKQEIEHRLEISPMTLYLWQKGKEDLPQLECVKVPRGKMNGILFKFEVVEDWLKKYRPKIVGKLYVPCGCKRCNKQHGRVQAGIPSGDETGTPVAQVAE